MIVIKIELLYVFIHIISWFYINLLWKATGYEPDRFDVWFVALFAPIILIFVIVMTIIGEEKIK